ncbi:MAG: hypothetical protein IPL05_04505 [Betaproteobacteria bacterium]|nr:hypothetical protein [Betaproteobacteria bacterium]
MNAVQCCNACPAVPELFSFEPVTLRTEHESAIITADIVLCPKCAAEAQAFPSIAARIIRDVLATPAKSTAQIAAENADENIGVAIMHLYQSDSVAECRELLAYYLTLIFGDEHEAAAEVVAQHLTTRILRGMEIECVGSAPGLAIGAAMGEFH